MHACAFGLLYIRSRGIHILCMPDSSGLLSETWIYNPVKSLPENSHLWRAPIGCYWPGFVLMARVMSPQPSGIIRTMCGTIVMLYLLLGCFFLLLLLLLLLPPYSTSHPTLPSPPTSLLCWPKISTHLKKLSKWA